MDITIHQQIRVNFLKVGSINNASVLQIGSSGLIQTVSNAYNTGGYTEPAEEAEIQRLPIVPLPHLPLQI
ncbi:spore germination protein GerPB [Halalkalibacillus halophilus]|uniref:spore germination protein GerPB n=1 Tax=Halalkalibacillus halophilus TaxID=392827 RepID=UPI000425B866|nr:spore germination protein GerPB [Halalkalibacillus halophilus]